MPQQYAPTMQYNALQSDVGKWGIIALLINNIKYEKLKKNQEKSINKAQNFKIEFMKIHFCLS